MYLFIYLIIMEPTCRALCFSKDAILSTRETDRQTHRQIDRHTDK